ncbi:MAG: sigma-54 dependent transcriptional regulator [Desulfarculaceae bacterium]|nr:sigma-54 dependent transcriptional regulator [Desulfarculaceae bacterium]
MISTTGASAKEREPAEERDHNGRDGDGFCFENIAGSSRAIKTVLEKTKKVAHSDSSVLITGESGTGKELVAQAVHNNSPRCNGPMVVINCGAIPGELLESELFGHEKGSFTGAHKSRAGRFQMADKGTIFLDEIGDMSPELQVKLLRALQERKIERLGGAEVIEVDIRVISATNKDLDAEVKAGTFREDLFYRLNVIPVNIPPLRERTDDIPVLVEHFQKKFAGRTRSFRIKNLSGRARQAMVEYDWPGNIRELENLVERLAVLSENDVIELDDLPGYISRKGGAGALCSANSIFERGVGFHEAVEQFQRDLIYNALERTDWVKAKAATLLQMNRTTLVEKIKKMNIEPREEETPFF